MAQGAAPPSHRAGDDGGAMLLSLLQEAKADAEAQDTGGGWGLWTLLVTAVLCAAAALFLSCVACECVWGGIIPSGSY